MEHNDKNALLLTQLVSMFHFAALQHMGKLKNPLTDKIERDLQQAQVSIDMLEMLHTKMKGNLSADEEKMFSTMLQELKLNYVDEAAKSQTTDQPQPSAPSPQTETTS